MNLIKKTVIFSDGAEGYVSVIRVGNDIGAKIVGAELKRGMRVGLKIGESKPVFAALAGERTELELAGVTFRQNDTVGCAIVDGKRFVAIGGSGIKPRAVIEHFSEGKEISPSTERTFSEKKVDDEEEKRSFWARLSSPVYGDFYVGVREKLDELFVIYPEEKNLNGLIPDSSWIRINYDGDEYYVVGKLRKNNRVASIAYGVPGKNGSVPPKIADEIASYLPVDGISPYDGYWLIFQDAETGKIFTATDFFDK